MSVDSRAISAVVICRNEGEHLHRTIADLQETLPPASEIIVVDDGSVDGSTEVLTNNHDVRLIKAEGLGVAKGRNRGARQASGDILIFVDGHVRLPRGWWQPLADALALPGAGAAAPAISTMGMPELKGFGLTLTGPELDAEWLPQFRNDAYPVPILPGACLAMRREVFQAIGGFDDALLSRGCVDNELGIRMWLLGYELYVTPGVEVQHLFRRRAPFSVFWTSLLHNRLRLTFTHFKVKRIRHVIEALQEHDEFAAALALVIDSDISMRRFHLQHRRVRSDDWFFDKFDLSW